MGQVNASPCASVADAPAGLRRRRQRRVWPAHDDLEAGLGARLEHAAQQIRVGRVRPVLAAHGERETRNALVERADRGLGEPGVEPCIGQAVA